MGHAETATTAGLVDRIDAWVAGHVRPSVVVPPRPDERRRDAARRPPPWRDERTPRCGAPGGTGRRTRRRRRRRWAGRRRGRGRGRRRWRCGWPRATPPRPSSSSSPCCRARACCRMDRRPAGARPDRRPGRLHPRRGRGRRRARRPSTPPASSGCCVPAARPAGARDLRGAVEPRAWCGCGWSSRCPTSPLLGIAVVALSSLIVLQHRVLDPGAAAPSAAVPVALVVGAALLLGALGDLVAPLPRFDPAVERGLIGVLLAGVAGGVAALVRPARRLRVRAPARRVPGGGARRGRRA